MTCVEICGGECRGERLLARRAGGDVRKERGGGVGQAVDMRAAQGLTVESLDAAAERMEKRLVSFLGQQPFGPVGRVRRLARARRMQMIDGTAVLGVEGPQAG